ncbi:Uridine nucleosidase 1 [Elasticomyces elasticus]|uniref:Uridine nucleosidase 1 n=1 Tax=Exophiala sideris TaxID=1016849 RepID=A0ABR0JSB4_9EURO|nr:Uridine nucleosidase 1 [Elasticomyces elasticus]KAK5040481.1 Uridine nucleosidase 1 [Exophiala sideris]KAK5043093.1 Uridine nucleosidase 1 [Exophiala sideris]KAK5068859.1 Uridine nucleosidase 1 [Exophiala sideris]KAK5186455.1 Uridine nucleosidase 1 [Eurotiomycetes sp. CCFEE 6388]
MTDRIPVWLDVDTAHHPQLNFLGVSSSHGNAQQVHTTNNSSAVLKAVGRTDVQVYPGASKPFCREEVDTPDIHGEHILQTTGQVLTRTRSHGSRRHDSAATADNQYRQRRELPCGNS